MAKKVKSVLKWHGGKFYLASKIISLMTDHDRYVEPFAGGLNVLLAKSGEGIAEYASDTNYNLMNFWRVLADPKQFEKFQRQVNCTPFSVKSFETAAISLKQPVDLTKEKECISRAVAFFIVARMSRQGLLKDFATPTSRTRRGMNENVSAWLSAVDRLPEVAERLRRVELTYYDALDAIVNYDSTKTLFYLDPPYMLTTRTAKTAYGDHEVSERFHACLLAVISPATRRKKWMTSLWQSLEGNEPLDLFDTCLRLDFQGKFVLSGYESELYAKFEKAFAWTKTVIPSPNHASSGKTKEIKLECVWTNYVPSTTT